MSQIVNGFLRKIKLHNLEKFFNEVDSISDFSKKYFEYLSSILNSIDTKELNKLELELDKARLEKKIYLLLAMVVQQLPHHQW